MILIFELRINFNQVRKFKDLNSKWKKNLILMKEKRQDDSQNKLLKRSESLKMRGAIMGKVMKENQQRKIKESEEHLLKIHQAAENSKLRFIRRSESIEEERRKTDLELKLKMDKLCEGKRKNMEDIQNKFFTRSANSISHIKTQWQIINERELEKEKNMEEKAFDKYTQHVI